MERYIAFDCGNSSVRATVGSFDGRRIVLEEMHAAFNGPIRVGHYDYWNILDIYAQIIEGLRLSWLAYNDIVGFGISTWGIDFALMGPSKVMLNNPLCYRNIFGKLGMDSLTQQELEQNFIATGIQNFPMNTLYQILGIQQELPEYAETASQLLLIPDLLNYFLTGEINTEISIVSTTGLVSMKSRSYAPQVFSRMGISPAWFPPIIEHGTIRGHLRPELASKLEMVQLPAYSIPAHDTSAAVIAVPAATDSFIFISCGTWSLIGSVIDEPIINDAVSQAGLSNEGGFNDKINLLRNYAGMHILQSIKDEIELQSTTELSWEELVSLAAKYVDDPQLPVFDCTDASLYNPLSMQKAVEDLTGLSNLGEVVASAYISLARGYCMVVESLEQVLGKSFPEIHIVGGGSRNELLCQLLANFSGKIIIAGPAEATSLGTIAAQVFSSHPELYLQDLSQVIRESVVTITYLPKV